jgi:hypothetical protein
VAGPRIEAPWVSARGAAGWDLHILQQSRGNLLRLPPEWIADQRCASGPAVHRPRDQPAQKLRPAPVSTTVRTLIARASTSAA